MSHRDDHDDANLLDALAADAPIEHMRARFEELIAEPPRADLPRAEPPGLGPTPDSGRRRAWLAWAAVALVAIGAALLTVRSRAPSLRGDAPEVVAAGVREVLRQLEAPSAFERLRGVNAAAALPPEAAWPVVEPALFERLERDASVNVRLAALDALLSPDRRAPATRLLAAFDAQTTAIVQAHLGHRLRRRGMLSRAELGRLLDRPAIHQDARNTLDRLEDL